jgi:hypothetical protein
MSFEISQSTPYPRIDGDEMTYSSNLLLDVTGAAFLEATVAAPFLATILAGVLAINAMYAAKLEAKARASRLAWLQADSGNCPERSCTGSRCQVIEAGILADGVEELDSPRSGRFSLGSFVRDVGAFFAGRITRGVASAHAPLPSLFGHGRTVQRGQTTLLCNTTGRTTDSGVSILDHACSAGLGTTEYAREVCG